MNILLTYRREEFGFSLHNSSAIRKIKHYIQRQASGLEHMWAVLARVVRLSWNFYEP